MTMTLLKAFAGWLCNILHNSVAHFFIPFLPSFIITPFHDWTAKLWSRFLPEVPEVEEETSTGPDRRTPICALCLEEADTSLPPVGNKELGTFFACSGKHHAVLSFGFNKSLETREALLKKKESLDLFEQYLPESLSLQRVIFAHWCDYFFQEFLRYPYLDSERSRGMEDARVGVNDVITYFLLSTSPSEIPQKLKQTAQVYSRKRLSSMRTTPSIYSQ